MQSHEGYINFLPALPSEWKNGSIKGLKARGGFEVDMEWRNGKLTYAKLKSSIDGTCKVKYSKDIEGKMELSNIKIKNIDKRIMEFYVDKGDEYNFFY